MNLRDRVKVSCSADDLMFDFNMSETAANLVVKKEAILLEFVNGGSHALVKFVLGLGQTFDYMLPVSVLRSAK